MHFLVAECSLEDLVPQNREETEISGGICVFYGFVTIDSLKSF